jgi:hypothetical protein
MRPFFTKLVIFLLPLLLAGGYIESKLSGINNSYNKKRQFLERQLDSVQVLITGNSQSLYSINPACFSHPGFNLSNISQSLYYDNVLLSNYQSRLPNLKLVIIHLSYFSLYLPELEHSEESWRDYFYYRFWDVRHKGLSYWDIQNYSLMYLYSMNTTFDIMRKGFKTDLADNMCPNGFMKYDTLNNRQVINDSLGRIRASMHNRILKEENFRHNFTHLHNMVKSLTQKGIRVVLLTSPVWSTYTKFANLEVMKSSNMVINELCNRYNVRYYNYFTDNRFTERDFHDNDHMNFVGASRFSSIINTEIINNYLK